MMIISSGSTDGDGGNNSGKSSPSPVPPHSPTMPRRKLSMRQVVDRVQKYLKQGKIAACPLFAFLGKKLIK